MIQLGQMFFIFCTRATVKLSCSFLTISGARKKPPPLLKS